VRSKPPDPWWVKLSDFGISKRAADNLAASSTLKGTLRYMAPELLGFVESGEESDSRNVQAADMWALGDHLTVFLQLSCALMTSAKRA
jgi:serine/threonine protein kinase